MSYTSKSRFIFRSHKMPRLHRMNPEARSLAVTKACARVIARTTKGLDPQATVTFLDGLGEVQTITRVLIGTGWNPTTTGTQEALIVRGPGAAWRQDMIPYTRLISVDPA
jgi:hypothetical protein